MLHLDNWTVFKKGPKSFTTDTWRPERTKYCSPNVTRSQAIARLARENESPIKDKATMKTDKQIKADKVNKAIASLAIDLKPIVDSIESNHFPTTQNNYGRYLQLLTTFCKGPRDPMLQIVTSALLDCGANDGGMASAYKIYKG